MIACQSAPVSFQIKLASMTESDATGRVSARPALMIFQDDLRLHDNAALADAARQGPVIAVYVREDPAVTGVRDLGRATQWWLHHSLARLAESLAAYGVPLRIFAGDPRTLIPEVAREVGAGSVSFSRRYHRPQRDLDEVLLHRLAAAGVAARSFPGHLLAEPERVATRQGSPYRVYTPFSRRLREVVAENFAAGRVPPSGVPAQLHGPGAELAVTRAALQELALLPTHPARGEPEWSRGFGEVWEPGEAGARRRVAAFVERVGGGEPGAGSAPGYAVGRDFPAASATSNLSPHLRFGEVSPHLVWAAVAEEAPSGAEEDVRGFQQELMWRDFAWHRLCHRPDLARVNVREEFNAFPWFRDPTGVGAAAVGPGADLRAWRAGRTGIGLVDAGMRELWRTGQMHNRVRMVAASLLSKNLGIHWRHGEEWFWDTLVDADPASNAFNWQWVAGCGDDAAPYFRIFNPETQARRFDPAGEYVARWVPEYGTDSYPGPIVDLRESRAWALAAYQGIKK